MEIFDWLSANPTAFIVLAGMFGLLLGSFLNVVIHRLPVMMQREWRIACEEILTEQGCQVSGPPAPSERYDLITPRSACPHCGHAITALENIPVFSWLALRGRCSGCKASISPRYPLVELLTAAVFATVAWHFGWGAQAAWAMVLSGALIALTFIDLDTQLLPDSLTLPLVWLGVLLGLAPVFTTLPSAVIGAVAGYLSLWSVCRLFKLLTGKDGMGEGDFKLLAALGAWLGWQMLPVIILLSSVVGTVFGIAILLRQRAGRELKIPFGPYLAIAGWIALLWGQQLIDGYLQFAGLQ